jgi:hypothetical protein
MKILDNNICMKQLYTVPFRDKSFLFNVHKRKIKEHRRFFKNVFHSVMLVKSRLAPISVLITRKYNVYCYYHIFDSGRDKA